MKKYNLKKLIKKYNEILSKRYGVEVDILEDSIGNSLDSIEAIQCDCICDCEDTYLECDYIKKYLYYKYIENDINDFKNMEV